MTMRMPMRTENDTSRDIDRSARLEIISRREIRSRAWREVSPESYSMEAAGYCSESSHEAAGGSPRLRDRSRFIPVAGRKGLPELRVDRTAKEPHRAVEERSLDPIGVVAAGGDR